MTLRSVVEQFSLSVPVVVLAFTLLIAGCGAPMGDEGGELRERWISDTESDVAGNHHAVAAGRVDGQPVIYVPIGGRAGREGCALVALNGEGEERWRHQVPPSNCTIHAVADPTIADLDRDGSPEVLATTTEHAVFAFHPLTGEVEFRANLSTYGYTHPILGDVTGDGDPELVVSDVNGTLYVHRTSGEVVWRRTLGSYTWAHPAVSDFDGDGDPEVITALGNGSVVAFGPDGTVRWNRHGLGSVTWMATRGGHGHDHGDGHSSDSDGSEEKGNIPDLVVATAAGKVIALDGANGEVTWTRRFGDLAAVRAYGDGDGDGSPEVYATAKDSRLRALDARSGETEWATTLTDGDLQMTPPPTLGDVDGDGDPELVAVTNDGRATVVNPADGTTLATYERDASVYTHSTLADTDDDGTTEIYVMYGDGKAVALEYVA